MQINLGVKWSLIVTRQRHKTYVTKVRKERLELSRVAPYASETYAYTNSATSAKRKKFFIFRKRQCSTQWHYFKHGILIIDFAWLILAELIRQIVWDDVSEPLVQNGQGDGQCAEGQRWPKGRDIAKAVFLEMLIKRSEERRVGKECTSWCRSRWSPYH